MPHNKNNKQQNKRVSSLNPPQTDLWLLVESLGNSPCPCLLPSGVLFVSASFSPQHWILLKAVEPQSVGRLSVGICFTSHRHSSAPPHQGFRVRAPQVTTVCGERVGQLGTLAVAPPRRKHPAECMNGTQRYSTHNPAFISCKGTNPCSSQPPLFHNHIIKAVKSHAC